MAGQWNLQKKSVHPLNACMRMLLLCGIVAGLMACMAASAFANPVDGVVTGGSATITSTPAELQIRQTSNRAVIEWKSFDIGTGEAVRFYQPGSGAVVINRIVNSTQFTAINGSLRANGNIFIINQNGVIISRDAHIDVASIVVSTADIANSDFMNATGVYDFNIPGSPGAVVENQGHISVQEGGLAALVAPSVRNSGVIEGSLAKIHLAAGDTFGVDLYGDGLLYIAVATPQNPVARALLAENSGSLVTPGGQVQMTAAAASGMVSTLINTSGIIHANSFTNRNGRIILTGSGAHVAVSGKIDVSGPSGGGTVKIGGDAKGAGTLAKAENVVIDSHAIISANAEDNGNGGSVAVWSNAGTTSAGRFESKGGANGGNGGFIETSSAGFLDLAGTSVDTSAPFGHFGAWLIDPPDLVVDSTLAATINAAMADVFLTADNNITFAADITMQTPYVNLTATSGNGGITGLNNFIRTNRGSLTFDTTGPIALNNYVIYTRGGDVSLTGPTISLYNNAAIGSAGGNIDINGITISMYNSAAVDTGGGTFDLTGTTVSMYSGATLRTGGGDFSLAGTTVSLYTSIAIDTGGGDFDLTGVTVSLYDNALVGTGGGDFTLSGTTVSLYGHSDIGTAGGSVSMTGTTLSIYDQSMIGTGGGDVFIVATGTGSILDSAIDAGGGLTAGGIDLLNMAGTPLIVGTDAAKSVFFGTLNSFDSSASGGTVTLQGDGFTGNNNCISAGGALACGAVSPPVAATADDPLPATLLTVTAEGKTKVYGALDPLLTYTYTGVLDAGDSFIGALLRTAGETVAGGPYAINQGTLMVDGVVHAYTLAYAGNVLTISQAPLVITAVDKTMIYGGAFPVLTASYNGFVNNDTTASLITAPTVISGTATAANAAAYPGTLTASGAVNGNYSISYTAGNLVINQAPLPVTATPQSKTFGAADPAFIYTAGAMLPGNVFTGGLDRDAGESAGSYAINLGTLSAGGNYLISYTSNNLIIVPAQVLSISPAVVTTLYPPVQNSGVCITAEEENYRGMFITGQQSFLPELGSCERYTGERTLEVFGTLQFVEWRDQATKARMAGG